MRNHRERLTFADFAAWCFGGLAVFCTLVVAAHQVLLAIVRAAS